MIRAMRVLMAAAVATVVAVPMGAGIAAADPLDMQCVGTQASTWSPGLTLIPTNQTVTVNTIYSPCVSATTPAVTSGLSGTTVQQTVSCLDLLGSASGARTITWNTGQTSVFTYNRTVTHVGGNTVVTLTGTITAGLFAGDTALEVVVGPTLDTLQCLTPPGITSRTGVTTLTIT